MKGPSILESALRYQELGFSIIPVRPDKKPYCRWEENQRQRASADQIKAAWKRFPDANVGIVTGSVSGVCVIDKDTAEGDEPLDSLLPDGVPIPTCQTPRGGQHLYFRIPETEIRNNARAIRGCDFRGEGGYAVAPPSINGAGRTYRWLPGLSVFEVQPPALPSAYISFVNSKLKIGKSVKIFFNFKFFQKEDSK